MYVPEIMRLVASAGKWHATESRLVHSAKWRDFSCAGSLCQSVTMQPAASKRDLCRIDRKANQMSSNRVVSGKYEVN